MLTIKIVNERTCRRIKDLAQSSGTSVNTWVTEALTDWIVKHRSERFIPMADRHDERQEDTTAIYFVE